MMYCLKALLDYEFLVLHRQYHILRHFIYNGILFITLFSIGFNSGDIVAELRMLSGIIAIIIGSLTIPIYIIKNDLSDGSLEYLISKFSVSDILLIKFIALYFTLLLGVFVIIPIIYILCDFNFYQISYLMLASLLLLMQITMIILVGNIIYAYFRNNVNVIIAVILPLIIPEFLLCEIGFYSLNYDIIWILVGLNCFFVPLVFLLSRYLMSNIYQY